MSNDLTFDEWHDAPRPRRGRPRVFTDQVLAQIPAWISEGWPLSAIAVRLGTTELSLYTTLSRAGISIRKPPPRQRKQKTLKVQLSKALLAKFEARAETMAVTAEHLATLLIREIARDDLYTAVLDFDIPQT